MMPDSLNPDVIYHNGKIYTADKSDQFCEAIAIKQGYITAVGSSHELLALAGTQTEVIDLEKRVVLPGLIDSHMHPFWGGKQLRGCNLNYAALTVEETLALLQQHLDEDPLKEEDDWLSVRAWQRQAMIPAGADMCRQSLDTLNTRRPVVLFSNDCHTLAANSRALEMLGITEETPVPADGKIGRDEEGRLNGILEDAPAMRAFDSIPTGTPEQCVLIARHVQRVLNQQGVTTVMDTRVYEEQLKAFAVLRDSGELTLRMCGAREITPDSVAGPQDAARALDELVAFNQRWNDPVWQPAPGFGVSHVKFFVDGVLQPPTMTASLLQPYRKNRGTHAQPDWQPTEDYGDLYFTPEVFNALVKECGRTGVHPHMHTVAEGAIEMALDALQEMRQAWPQKDVRPGLAHNELAAAHQYARFAELDVTAVLSYQWAGLPAVLIDEERAMLGEARFPHLEPQGRFLDAGARLAYGSDWPIDRLDEWYNLQIAMTRRAWDAEGNPAGPRLDNDRNLTLTEVLRSATIDAAYMIARDGEVGSLEPGKLADLIVLKDDIFSNPPETLFKTRVLRTVVGGKVVWQDA
ncbi:amidohydrolase [Citrobacter enshiensis]|uniref:Amidohydrolase family protein n=1 Tax=Citrobacter enshiensis TaxID=2971264 RepID=A0ABT8PYL4_9ENTR|nr:amidohydrolase family protein [Citrobacter enshiensis]MDN8601426.1 amidohydrolase family protein [Citrobacter enshiensis]WET40219.1 amidohydrolase family protein [Citrobacter enshiensis]